MDRYIFVLVSYSIFHSAFIDIVRVPMMFRPIELNKESKLVVLRLLIGVPVFVSFLSSFTLLRWTDVLIYTLIIRLGIFFLLTLFTPFLKLYSGYILLISSLLTIVSLF